MKTIQKGSKGTEVKILQTYLKIGADGIFGKNTEAAVNKWKDEKKLNADGQISETDWCIIAESLPTIKSGSNSIEVKMWQLFLGIEADGKFGSYTKSSTKAYQTSIGLVADGIVGPKTWVAAFAHEIVEPEPITPNAKPKDFKQYDAKWAKVVYTKNNTYNRNQTIKSSGCGPTSMADIVATWWDSSITPVELAALSVQKGYRTENSGTAWGFFKFIANKYGVGGNYISTASYAVAEEAIKKGAYVVCSMGPGLYTNGGHYICWWKTDGTYNYVNDPASAAANRAKSKVEIIRKQAKRFFIFYNK